MKQIEEQSVLCVVYLVSLAQTAVCGVRIAMGREDGDTREAKETHAGRQGEMMRV